MIESRNVDAAELARFAALVSRWWDPQGEMRPLHDLNPVRLEYVERAGPLAGRDVVEGDRSDQEQQFRDHRARAFQDRRGRRWDVEDRLELLQGFGVVVQAGERLRDHEAVLGTRLRTTH